MTTPLVLIRDGETYLAAIERQREEEAAHRAEALEAFMAARGNEAAVIARTRACARLCGILLALAVGAAILFAIFGKAPGDGLSAATAAADVQDE